MTTPEVFQLPTLEDELEELRAVGVDISIERLTPGDDDAAAAHLLRAIAACELELDRIARASEKATDLIARHYDRQMEPVQRRANELRSAVLALASRANFGGKAKSRRTPYGKYGRRHSEETVKITDLEKAIAWCRKNGLGDLVKSEPKVIEKLPHAEAKAPLLAYIAASCGVIPDGVEHVAAADVPFVEVDTTILAAERGDARESI